MPKLYVLVGVPGSGKSTWVANQEWAKNCKCVSTDTIIERYAKIYNKSYSDVFGLIMPRAVEIMTKQIIKARQQSKDIIWDQTSTTIESRKRKFRMLPDYHAIAIVFKTPEKNELERRLNSRPGKVIPNDVVENMINKFEMPTEAEGFKEIWYV